MLPAGPNLACWQSAAERAKKFPVPRLPTPSRAKAARDGGPGYGAQFFPYPSQRWRAGLNNSALRAGTKRRVARIVLASPGARTLLFFALDSPHGIGYSLPAPQGVIGKDL